MGWGIVSKPAKLQKVAELVPDALMVFSYGYTYLAVTPDDRHVWIDIHGPGPWKIEKVETEPRTHFSGCPTVEAKLAKWSAVRAASSNS